jgi:hypothetical protein
MLASASFDATIGMWEYVGGDFSFIASFEVNNVSISFETVSFLYLTL